MKNLLSISSCVAFAGLTSCAGGSTSEKQITPNIIYILADDLGYGDIGILGQKIIKTPNIDKLASDGMIFTNHYSGAPVSGPSRCILMTGKHSGHSSIRGNKSIAGVGVAPINNNDYSAGSYQESDKLCHRYVWTLAFRR